MAVIFDHKHHKCDFFCGHIATAIKWHDTLHLQIQMNWLHLDHVVQTTLATILILQECTESAKSAAACEQGINIYSWRGEKHVTTEKKRHDPKQSINNLYKNPTLAPSLWSSF